MRISLALLAILILSPAYSLAAGIGVGDLTAEHMTNPMGIGVSTPRLSWKISSDRPGEVQTAYEVRAASTSEKLSNQPDLWSSGKVASDQSVLVPWGGSPLASRHRVFWQVRVWGKDGNPSDWSAPAKLELGLLNPASEWKGKWITVDLPRYDIVGPALANANWITPGSAANQSAAVRLPVDLPMDAKILGGSISIAAEGLISLYVNGQATRQGPSSHTAPFFADIPNQLVPGKNVIGIYSLAVRGARGAASGVQNAIAAHGVINLANGQHVDIVTDGAWTGAADLAAGGDWSKPDYDISKWKPVTVEGPYTQTAPIRSADGTIGPGRYLRKTFTPKGPIASARLYATALGVYEASVNGHRVSEDQLSPGWTDYFKRVMVQSYDVTSLLHAGQPNALGVVLGDGWFAGRLGWMGFAQYASVSDHPSFNAQLEINYADGSTDTISSDESWKGGPGEIVGSDEQLGEVIDARKAVAYDEPGFDDGKWANVTVEQHDQVALDPQVGPPVRRLMELSPKKISRIGDVWIVDFGQNMVGHVRLTGSGAAGTTVEVLHGEMLNPDGTVYNENLRQAISLDTFTFAGAQSSETFEPNFTFHGFRYAQITGYPGTLMPENIRGIVVGSDTPDTGKIETSNPDVNQLISNIRWGQRGNFISVPTDCPQRDERQGWMGDAQVFAPTSIYNADVAGFFTKWMVDIDDGQLTGGNTDGAFCVTSPRVSNPSAGYAIWGDAGVLIPWDMYTAYGDMGFLEKNYSHMIRWVDYTQRTSNELIVSGGVGDNLAPAAGGAGRGGFGGAPGDGGGGGGAGPGRRAATGPASGPAGFGRGGRGFGGPSVTSVLDTAYFAHSAEICAKSAALLGKTDDAAKYDKLFHDIDDAFVKAYVHDDGSMVPGSQSTYVVALEFGLIPDRLKDAVVQHLLDDVQSKGHLSTGFVGVGFLLPALSDTGHTDVAFKLLLTDTFPSWLFTVKEGATTIWERWDGYTPDRGFQASSMNSFNHYSLGAVGKWLYSGAGGIKEDDAHPGFKHFLLDPQFSAKFDSFKVTFDSPYGNIVSNWKVANNQVSYDATVPPNSSATLTLPASGAELHATGDPIPAAGAGGGIELVPGTYHFAFALK